MNAPALKNDNPLDIIDDIGQFITETTQTADEEKKQGEKNLDILKKAGIKEKDIKTFGSDPTKINNIPELIGAIMTISYIAHPAVQIIKGLITSRQLEAQRIFLISEINRYGQEIANLRNIDPTIRNDIFSREMTAYSIVQTLRNNLINTGQESRAISASRSEQIQSTFKRLISITGFFLFNEFISVMGSDYSTWRLINSAINSLLSIPTIYFEITLINPINWFEVLKFWLRMYTFISSSRKLSKDILKQIPIVGLFIGQSSTGREKLKEEGIDPLRFLGETHLKTLASMYNPLAVRPGKGEYSYCGPGTRIDLRDIKGTKDQFGLPMSKPWSPPINSLDLGCKFHDYSYLPDGKGGFTEESQITGDYALIRFCEDILKNPDIGYLQKMDTKLVKQIFEFKLEFAHGVTVESIKKTEAKKIGDAWRSKMMNDPEILKIQKDRKEISEQIMKERKQRIADRDKRIEAKKLGDAWRSKMMNDPEILKIQKDRKEISEQIMKERKQRIADRDKNIERRAIAQIKLDDLEVLRKQALQSYQVYPPIVDVVKPSRRGRDRRGRDIYILSRQGQGQVAIIPKKYYQEEIIDSEPFEGFYEEFFNPEFGPPIIPPKPPIQKTIDLSEPTINIEIPKNKNYPTKKDFEEFKLKMFFLDKDEAKRNKELSKLIKLIEQTKKKFLNNNNFIPVFL